MIDKYKYPVLDCPVVAVDEKAAKDHIRRLLESADSGYSVAINAEKIHRYKSDAVISGLIDGSTMPYPDGFAAVLGLKLLHGRASSKINMPVLVLELAAEAGVPIAIIGSRPSTLQRALKKIVMTFPAIDIVYANDGYADQDAMVRDLKSISPRIVLICMGTPLQEKFGSRLSQEVGCFAFGGGGALDILAGEVRRAPAFMQKYGLEWLWRLVLEPKRFRRQLVLPIVMTRLFVDYLCGKKN